MPTPSMTHAERFRAVMAFQAVDRLPQVEWATWWDVTIKRWLTEGLELSLPYETPEERRLALPEITRQLGLDPYVQHWFHPWDGHQSKPAHHGAGFVADDADYERELPHLYPVEAKMDWVWERLAPLEAAQARDEALLWITAPGFFAWPRRLLGIQRHFLAFYDQPELMHRMNRDNAEWIIHTLRRMSRTCRPVFATIGEDMSYNHGPMLSRRLFDEFLAPYYRMVVPAFRELGITVFVDSDGDVTQLLPWLLEVGVEGILPLERQAGVDGMRLRTAHPRCGIIGHFDKLTMAKGEAAMRAEFERLLPLMHSGGCIPSVDHQTPPDVSLANYRIYVRLLHEYTRAAATRPSFPIGG